MIHNNSKHMYEKKSYKLDKSKRKRRDLEFIKIFLFVLPIAISVVLVLGVLLAIKEYNRTVDVGNIGINISSMDTEESSFSEEDSKKILIVASLDNKLPDDYKTNLQKFKGFYFDKVAIGPLKSMISDAEKEGIQLSIVKGYVFPEEQDKLYNKKRQELLDAGNITEVKAEANAKKIVPPGNYSEYQTGLSVEFGIDGNISTSEYVDTRAYSWLVDNCVNYGFILRYPEEKETETGMLFDPMCYRFVGIENAKRIRAMDMCLDEYNEYVNSR